MTAPDNLADAVRRGDVAAAAALLTKPAVVQRVRHTEAEIAAAGRAAFVPSPERFRLQLHLLEQQPRPWFICDDDNLFFHATTWRHNNALAWLFPPRTSAVAEMTQTLAFLFYGLLLSVIHDNNADAIEVLLSSHTFNELFSDNERRIVLEDAMSRIGGSGAETTISLLVAHGAPINDDDALPVYGSRARATVSLLRHIAAEGACLVGLQRVLHRMLVDAETLRELLHLGIDLRDDAVVDLRGTASSGSLDQLEIIGVLLAEAFVDVDAQDTTERFADSGTPLVRAVRGLFGLRVDDVDETPAFVELVLWFGADAHRVDRRGYSAVDYLAMAANEQLFMKLHGLLLMTSSPPSLAVPPPSFSDMDATLSSTQTRTRR